MSPDMATTTTSPRLRPIPQPPPRPLLGNLTDIDKEDAIGSITQMIRRYGEIVKLQVPNGPKNGRLFIGSQRLVHEIADQERFEKVVSGALEEVRSLAGDGTFVSPIDVGIYRNVVWSGRVLTLPACLYSRQISGLFTAYSKEESWQVSPPAHPFSF
jgi:hypothetical protein